MLDATGAKARLEPLIREGERIGAAQARSGGFHERQTWADLAGFRARGLIAIESIAGKGHTYEREFDQATMPARAHPSDGAQGAAILRALLADIEAGYLQRQADIVASEVFTDFLEMAEHLLGAGYFPPAASLTGAVLEDGLRRIARNNDVPVNDRDDINALGSKLREKGVFTPLVAKRITLWAEVRNNADHGQFDRITETDVRDLYRGVSEFLPQWLT